MDVIASTGKYVVCSFVVIAGLWSGELNHVRAQGVIPGTGRRIKDAGDTFEDDTWAFTKNLPKSSKNIDKQIRYPRGESFNGIWFESPKRGQPDRIIRVKTPEGGIKGSKGALLLQSLRTGIPNRATNQQQQDDFLMNFNPEIGGAISVSQNPSIVLRIYLPPFEAWEQRTGASFGWRASVTGKGPVEEKRSSRGFGRLFRRSGSRMTRKIDAFYPGFFIQLNCQSDEGVEKNSAVLVIRGDDYGQDFLGPEITKPGWWTLGMSFTGDGRVHYYASPGVDDLTAQDHIASHFSQSVHCHHFNTMFFNVVNIDDGKTWSTPWIIDDPSIYIEGRSMIARKGSRTFRR